MDYKQNGAYNLKRVELKFGDGVAINLIPLMLDATIYESLFKVGVSGNITLMDSNSLYTENFLGNGERIEIEFVTAGSDSEIKVDCVVYKSSPPTRTTENSSGLVLFFATEELINDKRTMLKRAFNGTVVDIVDEIHNKISNKPLATVPSKELHHIVSAHHRPLEMIAGLSRRAISTNNEHGYLYYQNNKQFCFLPLEYLYKQEPIAEYFYNNSGIYDDVNKKEEQSFNDIQDYKIVAVPDMITQITEGVYGSESVNLDIIKKKSTISRYDNQSHFSRNKSLAKTPNMNKELVDGTPDTRSFFLDNEPHPFHEFRPKNIGVILNGQKYAANVSVFGDSSLTCGSIIKAQLPIWGTEAKKNDGSPDPFSGKFLVAEIKHVLKKQQYMQTLKVIKDAFEVGK